MAGAQRTMVDAAGDQSEQYRTHDTCSRGCGRDPHFVALHASIFRNERVSL